MICKHCGKEVEENCAVCPYCGANLKEGVQAPNGGELPETETKRKGAKIVYYICIAVAVVCFTALIVSAIL